MKSKIQAARIVVRSGIPFIIACGRKPDVLEQVLAGAEEGTLFLPQTGTLRGRKRWIAFFNHPRGAVFVDPGAEEALCHRGRSLLPPGITRCEGEFLAGEVISICNAQGIEFARGIAAFSAADIRAWTTPRSEVIHRDNLVVL